MKLMLDIKDNKAKFFMELVKNFSYVRVAELTPAKAGLLSDLKSAIDYVNRAKKGKIKPRFARDVLNDL